MKYSYAHIPTIDQNADMQLKALQRSREAAKPPSDPVALPIRRAASVSQLLRHTLSPTGNRHLILDRLPTNSPTVGSGDLAVA
jgi:hypothetical protein